MKKEENHDIKFTPDFCDESEEHPYLRVDLTDNDSPITPYGFDAYSFNVDQTKQIIECLQAAVDSCEEISNA